MTQRSVKSQTSLSDDSDTRGIDKLLGVMARLRDPVSGCPWDLSQRAETIVPHTIEEAYEVADAIESGDQAALLDELGDLLFQVVFYAQLAQEEDRFTFDDIAKAHADKMISRHPHVFGSSNNGLSSDVVSIWEQKKEQERAEKAEREGKSRQSILDGITAGLPATTRATKLQKRAARVGFDWPDLSPVVAKLEEELGELNELIEIPDSENEEWQDALEDELGDVLFAVVNVARHLDVEPERALRRANRKFESRFQKIEQHFENKAENMIDASLGELERLWVEAKQLETRR